MSGTLASLWTPKNFLSHPKAFLLSLVKILCNLFWFWNIFSTSACLVSLSSPIYLWALFLRIIDSFAESLFGSWCAEPTSFSFPRVFHYVHFGGLCIKKVSSFYITALPYHHISLLVPSLFSQSSNFDSFGPVLDYILCVGCTMRIWPCFLQYMTALEFQTKIEARLDANSEQDRAQASVSTWHLGRWCLPGEHES